VKYSTRLLLLQPRPLQHFSGFMVSHAFLYVDMPTNFQVDIINSENNIDVYLFEFYH